MQGLLADVLFLALPYVALSVFVVGIIYRVSRWLGSKSITGLQTVSIVPYSTSYAVVIKELAKRVLLFGSLYEMEGDKLLIVGTSLFHFGIWMVIIAHFHLIFPFSMSPTLHTVLTYYLGGGAGVSALLGILILAFRRLNLQRMRKISAIDDYFAVLALLALTVSGLLQTLLTQPNYMASVSPWLISILTFHPELATMESVGILTTIHVVLGSLFLAYVPISKMNHIYAYFFEPTLVKKTFGIEAKKKVGIVHEYTVEFKNLNLQQEEEAK